MKRIIILLTLSVMAYAQFLDDKFVVLPKFEPRSQMTEEVKRFVENSELRQTVVQKTTARRDVLGRKTGDSTSYLVNRAKEERMKVVVSYVEIPEPFLGKMYGRYESGFSVNERRYWLNEIEMDEPLYLNKYNEEFKKIRRNLSSNRKSYVADLSASEIKKLFNGPEIVYISEYMTPRPASNDTTVGSRVYYRDSIIRVQSQIETWAFGNGYRGDSIGVYFTETGCPNLDYVDTIHYTQGNSCDHGVRTHPTGVTRVLQTTAPEAMIYGFDQDNYPLNPLSYPVPIYIGSHSWNLIYSSNPNNDSLYTVEDKTMDNYIFNNSVIEFVAAGNRNASTESRYVATPGKAVNAITVGAVEPDTYNYTSYTRWKNSAVKNQKPEIPNFSHFYFMGDTSFSVWEDGEFKTYNGTFDGTSASTPYTAAMAADVLSQHPFFKTHPEMFKALMLTGSTVSVADANSRDMDNYVRIKKIPQYFNMGWNTRSAYWNGSNSDFFDTDSTIVFAETGIVQGKRYRIAISWLSSGDYVFQNKLLPQDLDLYIYQYGSPIDSSTSATNPFELVDFVAPKSGGISVWIKRKRNSQSDNIVLGYNFLCIY